MEKRNSAFVLVLLVILLSFSSTVFSEKLTEFSDMPEDWSKDAVERAVENGLLRGKGEKIKGEENLSRAEMATIVNRAFNYQYKASLEGFNDIPTDEWYFEEMQKAIHMKSFQGDGGKLNPEKHISREEAFVVLARCFKLSEEDHSNLYKFSDKEKISYWAEDFLAALVSDGYISGIDGKMEAKKNITRAEFAKVMDNLISNYIVEKGEYTGEFNGNLMINREEVILKNSTIKGDLIIGDGVCSGDITLDNVKIRGRLLARGGGEDSIIIKGDSEIENILAGKIEGRMRIKVESGNIGNIILDCEDDILLEGKFANLLILGHDIQIDAINSNIQTAKIKGKNSKLILGKDSKINLLELDEKAEGTVVSGSGKINHIKDNSKSLKSYLVSREVEKKDKDRDRSDKKDWSESDSEKEEPEEEEEFKDPVTPAPPIEPEEPSKPEEPEEEEDFKDPVTPAPPIEPEEPSKPEEPEEEEEFKDPVTPVPPIEPEEPSKPEEPEEDEESKDPVRPVPPIEPEEPEEDEEFKDPVTPAPPIEPEEPTIEPEEPSRPDEPEEDEESKDPITPTPPSKPDEPSRPDEPEEDEEFKDPIIKEEISATGVKTGDELSNSILSGSFKNDTGENVKGELSWENGGQKVDDTGEYKWIFIPDNTDKYNEVSGIVEVKANKVEVGPVLVKNQKEFSKAVTEGRKHIKLTQEMELAKLSTTKPLIYNVQNGKIDLGGNKLTVSEKYFVIRGEDTIIQNGELETSGYSEIRFNGKNITMENITMEGSVYVFGVGNNEEITDSNKYSLLIKNCHIKTKDEGTDNTYNIIEVSINGNASVTVQGGSLTTNNKYAFRVANYEGNLITIKGDVTLQLGDKTKKYDSSRSLAPFIEGEDTP